MPKATRKTSVDEMLLALSDSTEQKPDIANDEKQTPDSSPSKSKAKSARSSPTMPKTYDSNAKALFAKMIVDAGIKSLTKAEVQQATGLSPETQKEMVRKDKGSLRRALYAACASL